MANQPTHLPLVILRDIRVRKDHIAGSPAAEGKNDLMRIVHRGDKIKVITEVARDLIIAESALEEKFENTGRIKEFMDALEEEKKSLKKAA